MKGRSGQSNRRVGRWLPPASDPEQSRQSPVLKWISDYVDLGITLSDARSRADCPPSRRSARPKEPRRSSARADRSVVMFRLSEPGTYGLVAVSDCLIGCAPVPSQGSCTA